MGTLVGWKSYYGAIDPAGIMEMFKEYGIDLEGKRAVVIGRSNIVGKPMAQLLLAKNATVTLTHSRTHHLPKIARRADILVVAIGRAKFVTADFVKEGAVVIDVGMNRDENGKLCGDVDFDPLPLWPVILLRYQEGWAYDRHNADGADLRSSCSCLKK